MWSRAARRVGVSTSSDRGSPARASARRESPDEQLRLRDHRQRAFSATWSATSSARSSTSAAAADPSTRWPRSSRRAIAAAPAPPRRRTGWLSWRRRRYLGSGRATEPVAQRGSRPRFRTSTPKSSQTSAPPRRPSPSAAARRVSSIAVSNCGHGYAQQRRAALDAPSASRCARPAPRAGSCRSARRRRSGRAG